MKEGRAGAKSLYLHTGHSMFNLLPSLPRRYVRSQMCDPAKKKDCGLVGPETTTTPAYHHALTSPRPATKYTVATIGMGLPASTFVPLLSSLPSRAYDALVRSLHDEAGDTK